MSTNNRQKITVTNERFLRWPEVKQRVGFSRSTVHLLIKQGKFPAPCKISSRASAWQESSINEWISVRVAASTTEG